MGNSFTWSNIKRRHNVEADWLENREQSLKLLSKRQQTPELHIKKQPEEPKLYVRPNTALGSYRPCSTEPPEISFFKTEVDDIEVSKIIKQNTQDTSFSHISPKHSISVHKIPRSNSALRVKNRPPPTFFGSAAEAIKKKYAIRTKILEEPKLPLRNIKEELKKKIIRVMTARAEVKSRRLTPSRHNLFRRL